MKKFCDICKVEIEETKTHCPLCGRCCVENPQIENQTNSVYPEKFLFLNKRRIAFNALIYFILFANIVCISANFLFSGKFSWSSHILYGSIFLILGLILPAKSSFSICKQFAILFFMLTAYAVVLRFTLNFKWGIVFGLPFFYISMAVYGLFSIIFKKYNKMEILIPIFELILLEIGLFVAILVLGWKVWPVFAALISGLSLLGFLLLFNFKKSKTELEKRFHL